MSSHSQSTMAERAVATAFAPASVGNVAVGFDVLGHSFQAIGDRVTARRVATPGVTIASITGTAVDLPKEPEKNTAGMAVLSMVRDLNLDFGVELVVRHAGVGQAHGHGFGAGVHRERHFVPGQLS